MRSPSPRRYNRSPPPRSSYGRHRSPSPRRRPQPSRRMSPLPRRRSPLHRSLEDSWRKPRSPHRRGMSPPQRRGMSPLRRGMSPPRRGMSPPRRDRSPHRARDKEWSSGSRGAVIQEAESTVVDERRYRSSERPRAPRRHSPADHRSHPHKASPRHEPQYKDRSPATSYTPQKLYDQTSTSLHDRFSGLVKNQHPFAPKENISVGIERNVPGNERAVVDAFVPDQILISRRRGEGEVTLCQRDEFLGPQDEDHSERRVIRVSVAADEPLRSQDFHSTSFDKSFGKHENFKIESREKVWQEDERRFQRTRSREVGGSAVTAPVISNPHDLRHNLGRKRDGATDLRQRIGPARRGRDQRVGGAMETEELPDFSQRPDKGKFEEWQNNPESIPKGTSYFEHDNRGDFDYWQRRGRGSRGRGWRGGNYGARGGYQSRGYQGGGYQQGGYSRRDTRDTGGFDSGDWKHDKYSEIEGDPEPTSTT